MADEVTLCGTDTFILDEDVQGGLADGDCVAIEFPNDIANVKVGKGGSIMAAVNQNGKVAEVTLRYRRGSKEDKALNSRFTSFLANPSKFVMLTAEFIKKLGDGTGVDLSDNYVASSGVPQKQVPTKSNPEGDPDQGVSVYKIKFGKCARIIT